MSGRDGSGTPLDVELLARLDAGALDPGQAARERAVAAADPRAVAVLAALAATRAELAGLPLPPPPPGAVRRWLAAVRPPEDGDLSRGGSEPATRPAPATTPASTAAVPAWTPDAGSLAAAPPNPRPSRQPRGRPSSPPARRPRERAALVAAVLLVLAAGLLWPRPDPPRVDDVDLAAAARSAVGSSDLGALADPARRAGCLRAAGVLGLAPDAVPLGGRRVQLARGPAVLLVFATGELGVFDVVLVDPDCGPAAGTLLGTARVGR